MTKAMRVPAIEIGRREKGGEMLDEYIHTLSIFYKGQSDFQLV